MLVLLWESARTHCEYLNSWYIYLFFVLIFVYSFILFYPVLSCFILSRVIVWYKWANPIKIARKRFMVILWSIRSGQAYIKSWQKSENRKGCKYDIEKEGSQCKILLGFKRWIRSCVFVIIGLIRKNCRCLYIKYNLKETGAKALVKRTQHFTQHLMQQFTKMLHSFSIA